jgi:hypothetical protein
MFDYCVAVVKAAIVMLQCQKMGPRYYPIKGIIQALYSCHEIISTIVTNWSVSIGEERAHLHFERLISPNSTSALLQLVEKQADINF